MNLDSIPELDYSNFYQQLYALFPEYKESVDNISLSYETSRFSNKSNLR